MHDDVWLDDLERYLQAAPIIDRARFQHHGAHASVRLVLVGALAVLAKPADAIADQGDVVVGREVAAWIVARELGSPDVMAPTVLRTIESPDTGDETRASLQVLWPDVDADAPVARFSDQEVWRAAVFDALIAQTDRGGHNWLALPAAADPAQLKLVDHGYAFGPGLVAPNSTFYELRKGQDLPANCRSALLRLMQPRQEVALGDLLADPETKGVFERAQHLLDTNILEI